MAITAIHLALWSSDESRQSKGAIRARLVGDTVVTVRGEEAQRAGWRQALAQPVGCAANTPGDRNWRTHLEMGGEYSSIESSCLWVPRWDVGQVEL